MILEHCDTCCTMTESRPFTGDCKKCRMPRRARRDPSTRPADPVRFVDRPTGLGSERIS